MPPLQDSRPLNCRRSSWHLFVIGLALLALTLSLETRTSIPTTSHSITAQPQSSQASRQQMDGDAFQWVSPAPVLTVLQVPTFYPRVAPAGPLLPYLLFDESLYNRPPPSC